MKKQIAILGSTGSIGTQALQVVKEHSDLYEVYCLTANNRVEELARQAREFNPAAVVIANEDKYEELKQLLADLPDKVTVDISSLGLDKRLRTSDITVKNARILTDRDTIVCGVKATRNSNAAAAA